MADIDKSLPNDVRPDEVAEEVDVEEIEELKGPVEVTEDDDGATIDFDPSAMPLPEEGDFFANLNELLPEEDTDAMGSQLQSDYMEYKMSRKEWERAYITGLDLLGFKYTNRTEPFQGASGATHPVLAEAVTQFQALAYKELLPADGPVRTMVMGKSDPQKEMQAQRVKNFMNYQIMDKMTEYESDFDQMLFYLPLSGSTFKKVYYDDLLGRAVSKFVPADDLIVPYTATSLDDAESVIHVVKMSENELRKQMVSGFYSDIELTKPTDTVTNELEEQYEKDLGYIPGKIGREVENRIKPYAAQRQEELAYDLRRIYESEQGPGKLSEVKKVPNGTPLTIEMAQLLLEKSGDDEAKAEKLAKQMGFTIPDQSIYQRAM